jgi:hypothetical protein
VDYYNERWYEFTGRPREDEGDSSKTACGSSTTAHGAHITKIIGRRPSPLWGELEAVKFAGKWRVASEQFGTPHAITSNGHGKF